MIRRDPAEDIRRHVAYDHTVNLYAEAFDGTIERVGKLQGCFADLKHEDSHVYESFCKQTVTNLLRIQYWAEQPVEDSAFAARNMFELALWLEWLNLNPSENMKIFGGLLIQDLKDVENAARINLQTWASVTGGMHQSDDHPIFRDTYEDVVEHWKEQAREKNLPWVKWSDYGAGVFAAQLNRQEAHKDLYKLACKFTHPSPYSLVFPNYLEDHAYYVLAFAGFSISAAEAILHQLELVVGRLNEDA